MLAWDFEKVKRKENLEWKTIIISYFLCFNLLWIWLESELEFFIVYMEPEYTFVLDMCLLLKKGIHTLKHKVCMHE